MRGAGGAAALRLGAVVTVLLASLDSACAISLDAGPIGRWSVGGWTEFYGVVPINMETPRQLPEWITALQLTGDIDPKLRFYLDVRSTFGGPQMHPTGLGYVTLRDTFQNTSPQVETEEIYADIFLPSLDVRIGKQKFAWGKLDAFQPTDVLNPRRYTDPFIMSVEDQKIGIPALQAAYYPPALGDAWPQDLRATLVWVPFPIPPRFPLQDERWFPAAYQVPPTTFIPGSDFGPQVPDILTSNEFSTANNPPVWQIDQGAIGLRLTGLWHETDWDLYYYNGPETAPAFAFNTLLSAPDPTQFARCILGGVPAPCQLNADVSLHPINGRIQLGGADAAFESHGFTFRTEGAFSTDRFVPRSVSQLLSPENLARATKAQLLQIIAALSAGEQVPVQLGDLFVRRDVVDWGAAVDYHYLGWTPVLQLNQTILVNNSANLLVPNVDTRLFFVVRKPFFAERLQTETGVIQGLNRSYTAAIARLTYSITDQLRARIGYLLIAGSENSVIGQFKRNDEGYVELRLSF